MSGYWKRLSTSARVAAVAVAAIATLGPVGLAVAGPSTAAFADENGSQFCYLSSGSIAAPSTVAFGQLITVSWSASPACPDLAIIVSGPGFASGGETVAASGSRQLRATPAGTTMTWTLTGYPMDSSAPTPITLATRTITVR